MSADTMKSSRLGGLGCRYGGMMWVRVCVSHRRVVCKHGGAFEVRMHAYHGERTCQVRMHACHGERTCQVAWVIIACVALFDLLIPPHVFYIYCRPERRFLFGVPFGQRLRPPKNQRGCRVTLYGGRCCVVLLCALTVSSQVFVTSQTVQ